MLFVKLVGEFIDEEDNFSKVTTALADHKLDAKHHYDHYFLGFVGAEPQVWGHQLQRIFQDSFEIVDRLGVAAVSGVEEG